MTPSSPPSPVSRTLLLRRKNSVETNWKKVAKRIAYAIAFGIALLLLADMLDSDSIIADVLSISAWCLIGVSLIIGVGILVAPKLSQIFEILYYKKSTQRRLEFDDDL